MLTAGSTETTEPASFVTYEQIDGRGQPGLERVGAWGASALTRRFDPRGRPTGVLLPEGIATGGSTRGFVQTFDDLDRVLHVGGADAQGDPLPTGFGATLGWTGASRLGAITTDSVRATKHTLSYRASDGRLGSLALATDVTDLGGRPSAGTPTPAGRVAALRARRSRHSASPQVRAGRGGMTRVCGSRMQSGPAWSPDGTRGPLAMAMATTSTG